MANGHGGRRPGAGRKPGVPNKISGMLKGAIYEAFETAGGVDYLVALARHEPKVFAALLGKCVPAEIKAELESPEIESRVIVLRPGDVAGAVKLLEEEY